jgi:hypothetical protein
MAGDADDLIAGSVGNKIVLAVELIVCAQTQAAVDRVLIGPELPEPEAGRWGQGLTAGKMETCVWVRPELVAEIQFLEWTGAGHLRHTNCSSLTRTKIQLRLLRKLNVPTRRSLEARYFQIGQMLLL